MKQENYKTVTQTSLTTIICDGKVFYTREAYMSEMGLSPRSLGSPYAHVKAGKAEQFNFFNTSFIRSI